MKIVDRRRGRGRLLGLTALAGFVAASLAAAPTGAQEEPAPPPPVFDGGYDETPLPGFEEYAGCPLLTTGQFRFCIAITVNGDLQLGGVGGTIDDLKMVMGAAAGLSGDPVLVPARGGSGPTDVEVSGGILGIPELDPVLGFDSLHLLSLSATPQLGELMQVGLDQIITIGVFQFLGFPDGEPILEGDEPAPLPAPGTPFCSFFMGSEICLGPMPTLELNLPLDLKLNNLLLGDQCTIGPIDLGLTNGTTTPPAGVEPLTGSSGSLARNPMGAGVDFHVDGIEFVGNNFAVPGSDCSGIAGAGDLLGSVGVGNSFETLINQQSGLPSPAGQNTARLTVDLHVASQNLVYGDAMDLSPTDIDFGDVPAGTTSEPETVTITNRRTTDRFLNAPLIDFAGNVDAVTNECLERMLAPGESCQVTVTFSPAAVGDTALAVIRLSSHPDSTDQSVSISGTGV